ncbi:hypothetical protein [Rhodococcus sp. IEGM 1318]|uniref:hypothetical protein n=1 Tax=Rhodococcus sp. IEGM 1318 TaxID=3082226 RepID=UPI002953DC6B|nr:hypothetical protein [Rhodococcus sp. IEGM 1318]MDV8009177.1 hypothetical protein [Rhodococcus sp. IEGM 1318]
MSTTSATSTTGTTTLPRTIAVGAIAGLIGSLAMAMFAMIAALTYQNSGFFTPLYHIGSVFIDPSTMMTSMQQAMGGQSFSFAFGPAVVGALVHMMVGIMYGIVFALIVHVAKLRGPVLLLAGMLYGAVVFAVSAWAGLPIAASIFSSGDQVADMASMVGYGTFAAEHLLYGLVTAAVLVGAGFRAARARPSH